MGDRHAQKLDLRTLTLLDADAAVDEKLKEVPLAQRWQRKSVELDRT